MPLVLTTLWLLVNVIKSSGSFGNYPRPPPENRGSPAPEAPCTWLQTPTQTNFMRSHPILRTAKPTLATRRKSWKPPTPTNAAKCPIQGTRLERNFFWGVEEILRLFRGFWNFFKKTVDDFGSKMDLAFWMKSYKIGSLLNGCWMDSEGANGKSSPSTFALFPNRH